MSEAILVALITGGLSMVVSFYFGTQHEKNA